MNIMIIGLGNMGFRMFNKIKDIEVFSNFFLIDKRINEIEIENSEKYKKFTSIYEIQDSDLSKIDFCILAFKPQQLDDLIFDLKRLKNSLFISILAGVECSIFISKIDKKLKIIRLMPNVMIETESSVLSGVYENLELTEFEKYKKICSYFGKIFWLKNESLMHNATVLTGSSPAYIALFVKNFVESSINFGLKENESFEMFFQTIISFVEYCQKTGISMDELIKNVSSKKGVTECGMENISKISNFIKLGYKDAINKSQELNSINKC